MNQENTIQPVDLALVADDGRPRRGRVLITGGSSGIGYAFAKAFALRGLDLVLAARDRNRLEQTAAELSSQYGVEVDTVPADLSTNVGIEAVTEMLHDGSIAVFVNNAGRGLHANFEPEDLPNHLSALDLMVKAPLILGTEAAAVMRERGRGVIINIGSVAGLIAMNNYSAIKSWMNTFSDALALELEGTPVRVMTLLPGWVRTEFHERAQVKTSKIPDFLWLNADRLVADCLRDVERGKSRSIPSLRFKILAFLAVQAPPGGVRWVTRMIRKGRQ